MFDPARTIQPVRLAGTHFFMLTQSHKITTVSAALLILPSMLPEPATRSAFKPWKLSFLNQARTFHQMLGKLLTLTLGSRHMDPVLSSNDANRGYCSIETPPTLSLGDDFEDFGHSYQALRLCLLHLALYYGLAVLAFSFVFEQWKVIDSVYFSTATFTTVGRLGVYLPGVVALRFLAL